MGDMPKTEKAVLYAAGEPSEAQKKRFINFLTERKGKEVELEWVKDESLGNGFKLCASRVVAFCQAPIAKALDCR